jgi:DNA repair exonuclease SbcCD ATPase subunit
VEAAHIPWRPLGLLLVEQGLLTDDELEQALAQQQVTGKRLGETIVECGFVSPPDLSNALAAQYGIKLTTEKGFGTGLRAQIQRRYESDRGRPTLESVPDRHRPSPEEVLPEVIEPEAPPPAEAMLLTQLEEQWARLAAAEESLAARDRDLALVLAERDQRRAQAERLARRARRGREEQAGRNERRRAQVVRFVERVRARDAQLALHEAELSDRSHVAAQLEEQRARLAAAERQLAEREQELAALTAARAAELERRDEQLAALTADRDRRRAQAVRFVQGSRKLQAELGARDQLTRELEEQRARLAAAEQQLAAVAAERDQRRAQVVRFVQRVRARDADLEARDQVTRELEEQRAKLAAAEHQLAEGARELAALAAAREAELESHAEELRGHAEIAAELEEQQQAKLAAVEQRLAERERELEALAADRDRRRAQAVGFVRRMRMRDEELAQRHDQVRVLEEATGALRDQVERLVGDVEGCDAEIERLRSANMRRRAQAARFVARIRRPAREDAAPSVVPAASHLVFLQLAGGYELVERAGPPPPRNSPVEFPELCDGALVVAGSRPSPFPGDTRPCVVAQAS